MPRVKKNSSGPPPSRREIILAAAERLTPEEAKAAAARMMTDFAHLWDEATQVRAESEGIFVARGITWTFLSAMAQAIRRHVPPEVFPLLEDLDRF